MPEFTISPESETEWAGESSPTSSKHASPPSTAGGVFRLKYSAVPPSSAASTPPTTASYPPLPGTRSRSLIKVPPSTADSRKQRVKTTTVKNQKDISLLNAVKANYRFIYRINDGVGTTNTILQKVCEERGWKEFRETSILKPGTTPYERAMRGATGWNLWWSYSIYQFSPYKYLRNWQFTNHNPKGFQFCNKLYLTMFMRKMQVIHGPPFDFYPLSFIVPEDYVRLHSEHVKRAGDSFTEYNHNNLLSEKPTHCCSTPVPTTPKSSSPSAGSYNFLSSPYSGRCRPRTAVGRTSRPSTSSYSSLVASLTPPTPANIRFNPVWISKPVALSQGKGIFLTTDLGLVTTDRKSVVQEYISRPLLIGGYKWDIRIYVCVAAIDPLVIYIYNEGLCRFCTEKYDTKDLSRMYSHLTNASLNKLSPNYEQDKELIGQGCKWSLRQLRQHFRERNISDWLLWQKVMAMVVLTVVGDALRLGYSASNRNCFDLFGFDVLVDENLKPWLLECNYSPGLGGDCKTDEVVKIPMLHELFNLLGFPDKNTYRDSESETSSTYIGGSNGNGDARSQDIDEEVIQYDKDDITRHYFDMLLTKLKFTTAEEDLKAKKSKWTQESAVKTENRLNDAKSIYSQNLVVQYLKNQSAASKISKQARDQLISVAAKKLRIKLSEIAVNNGTGTKKEKKPRKPRSISTVSTQSLVKPPAEEIDENNNIFADKNDPNAHGETPSKPKSGMTTSLLNKIQQEFPAPDSEAFQKLKYYFDAGVDYPMDAKTGKFKGCPALISVKKDWFNPPRQEGGWIRVYPFDARTTKSPYKSSLTDIRQAVRSVESYIKVAEHLYLQYPNESDEFFRRKIKSIGRRDTEVWTPPSHTPSSQPPTRPETCIPSEAEAEDFYSNTVNDSDNDNDNIITITDTDLLDPNYNSFPLSTRQNPYCWQTFEELE